MKFQFTPLREGRPFFPRPRKVRTDFNSRPSARGDALPNPFSLSRLISIHAPPRGATRRGSKNISRQSYFNSRPSARGDSAFSLGFARRLFQFTPLREGRQSTSPIQSSLTFQFTPLREGRRAAWERIKKHYNFNSRPSARGDAASMSATACSLLFQFTPLREGRLAPCPLKCGLILISIHAPPRGATWRRGCNPFLSWHFNSRPSARGDH